MPEYLLLFRKPPTDTSNGYADIPVVKEKPLCDDNGTAAEFNSKNNWRKPLPGTGYSRAVWQMDAHGFSRSSGNRLLSIDELRTWPHERLYKWWRERDLGRVYDFEEHVNVAELLDREERLPATFMLLPPHSWHEDVWTDITRMRTLNGAQSAKGKEMHLCPLQFDIVDRAIVQYSNRGDVVYDPFVGLGTVAMRAVQLGRIGWGCELSPSYFADALWYLKQAEADGAMPKLFDMEESAEGR
jgi:DNA modification methylase